MADLDEFDLIARRFAPLSGDGRASLGLTDDAAVLVPDPGCELVVTTDTLVEGVHFPENECPDLIARKALRVNLSDVAAMGARPTAVLLNLGLKAGTSGEWVEAFADGLADDLRVFGVPLIGGDTVASPKAVTVTVTAFGQVEIGRALKRSGARPGDLICVSGTLGDAAIGLKVALAQLQSGDKGHDAYLTDRYRVPQPRTVLGARLGALEPGGLGACMDVSDGLLQDLGHICEASGLGATVERDRVPMSDAVRFVVEKHPDFLESVVAGGDDYELLFTVTPDRLTDVMELTATADDAPVTVIGRMREETGVDLLDDNGATVETGVNAGYRHRF